MIILLAMHEASGSKPVRFTCSTQSSRTISIRMEAPGGCTDIACRFTFDGADAGHGTCDASLVDNAGTTLGTFLVTFTGKRLRVAP